jgi:formyltetrahydrofolate-dependent phosphoribosylglycinamide formyltransferase
MLNGLQKRWGVSGWQLAVILITFAVGGSLTGYAGRKILGLIDLDQAWLRIVLYILLITILWPLFVLLISIPFGQFSFFRKYITRVGRRFGIGEKGQKQAKLAQNARKIAIFASGTGSNAQKIIDHFRRNYDTRVVLIVTNNPSAGVLQIAKKEGINSLIIDKERFFKNDAFLPVLAEKGIDFIVLAGFLWKIPQKLLKAYPGKIINIHPALLPKYGGKGMYGHHVHDAVLAAGDTESGITIHYVDEQYDHGQVIRQVKCPVLPGDTALTLAARVHLLEHMHFPKVIEELISQKATL